MNALSAVLSAEIRVWGHLLALAVTHGLVTLSIGATIAGVILTVNWLRIDLRAQDPCHMHHARHNPACRRRTSPRH